MLQSMGSQRVKQDLEAEQKQMEKYPICGSIKQKKNFMENLRSIMEPYKANYKI